MSQKILLVDGHSIANRAFYGLPLLTNTQGVHTNALLGFFNILFRTMDEVKPDAVGIAFDLPAPTFRHQMYEAYKGNREGFPDELKEQIPLLQELLEKAGIRLLTKEGYEADDILGTIGKRHSAREDEVMILSGDRDLLQLVDEHLTLLIPKTKKGGTETEIYHIPEVTEKYGVGPEGYLQMKALMGDSSDNIPGVPSSGEKTASKIILAYGNVEEAIRHAAEIKPAKAGANLQEYQDQARLSLKLATICTEVPEPGEVTPVTPVLFQQKEFIDGLRSYELKSLLSRVNARKQSEPTEEQMSLMEAAAPALPADEVKAATRAQLTGLMAKAGQEKKMTAVFPLLEEGRLVGFALCCGEERLYFEPAEEEDISIFADFLAGSGVPKVFFDLKPIQRFLLDRQLAPVAEPMDDLMLAAYLLNASKGSYTVDELAVHYLEEYIPTESDVLGTGARKKTWSEAGFDQRAAYALTCARVLYRCRDRMIEDLREKEAEELYQEIELPLTEVLASMESFGIRCDAQVLEEIGSFLRKEIARLRQDIYDMAGEEFNINSTKQLGVILFERLGLPAGKKTKSGYSTSAEVLEGMIGYHPIIGAILQYRQLSKLESTYVEGLKPFIGEDGHIHPSFQQAVTATGRLSCTDPNLQNIPIREDMGRQLRRAFLPSSEDYFFMDADYSQIELRLLADMSADQNLIDAYQRGDDIHRLTASQVLHIPYEEVSSAQRSSAKAVNFGIVYGISAFSLAGDLGISNQEASDYINHYFLRFPGVKRFLDQCVADAKAKGYGETKYHRRRQIEELRAKNFAQRSFGERVAKNMPIQGTAADIIKIAMNRVYYRMKAEGLKSRMIVQVHDELLIEVYRPEEKKVEQILKEEMTGAASLLVPLVIEVHTGENWYDAK